MVPVHLREWKTSGRQMLRYPFRISDQLVIAPLFLHTDSVMDLLVLFILTCSFAVGIMTYILAFSLFFRRKSPLENAFLLTLTFFLLIMLISVVIYYASPVLERRGLVYFVLLILVRLTAAGLVISLISFIQLLVHFGTSRKAKLRFFLLSAVGCLLFMGLFLYSYSRGMYFVDDVRAFDYSDILLYLVTPYPIILFFLRYRSIEDPMLRKVVRSFIITAALFIPTIILDDFSLSISMRFGKLSEIEVRFLFFPVMYIVFNVLLLYHGFQYYIRRSHTVFPDSGSGSAGGEGREKAGPAVPDEIATRYNITPRERELIALLLEGYSNRQIGEALFISPATVRNHLHNIFEKTGVSSRMELVRLCADSRRRY